MIAPEIAPSWQQAAPIPQLKLNVSRYEQFEIWQQSDGDWERIAYFQDLNVASAMAKPRSNPIQLKRVTYDGGTRVDEEVLLDVGARRTEE